uniref:Uncharacterized protein n=1 Tax=Setaria italica TaxID=4555 RepID=K4AJA5_SETIT
MQVTCSVRNSHSPSLYTGAFTSSYTQLPRYRSHVSGTLTTVRSAAVAAAAFADDAFSAASSSARRRASSAPPPPVTVGSVTSRSFSCTTSTALALAFAFAAAAAAAPVVPARPRGGGRLEDAHDDLLPALCERVDGGVRGGLGLLQEVQVGGLGADGAGAELEVGDGLDVLVVQERGEDEEREHHRRQRQRRAVLARRHAGAQRRLLHRERRRREHRLAPLLHLRSPPVASAPALYTNSPTPPPPARPFRGGVHSHDREREKEAPSASISSIPPPSLYRIEIGRRNGARVA